MRILLTIILFSLLFQGCASSTAPAGPTAPSAAADAAEGVFAAAIRGRRPVAFVYNGVSRVAHPHRMGPSVAKNGKVLVRAWEVRRGDEATGTWKLFDVGKASGAALLEGTFSPAPGYGPRDRAIPEPSAEIEITKGTKGETADGADLGG